MKNYKIFYLIFLLFLNTAYAKWEVTNQKNCKVWLDASSNKSNKLAEWSGKCVNGYADGKGKIKFTFVDDTVTCTGSMLKGKQDGYTECKTRTGNSLSCVVKNDEATNAIINWKSENCPTCPKKFTGTLYKGFPALGILTLVNGKSAKLQYYPSIEGCLVWNTDARVDEVITWSGGCTEGYASGKGILKYLIPTQSETITGNLNYGKVNGEAMVVVDYAKSCTDCLTHFKGRYENHKPIAGVATFGNGQQKKINEKSSSELSEEAMVSYIQSRHISWMMNNEPGLWK